MRLRALLDRATSGERIHGRPRFRPSLADKVLRDPFWVWCQYHVPRSEAVNQVGRYEQMRFRRGVEHEDAWVASALSPCPGNQARLRLRGPRPQP